eukprot:CAMPEP_0206141092 /NCGR_PEP_ID=MMETSP1473-20131121/11769_1 /ASSEMBLY_ACC=CAM_ASM_001109 /TAXON_ID=1461547 /ORGANISM="Stichococcus sp, Strain RCC1054" /LENGTH=771 /DNA_ID=CAMNT_0053535505 /DNA_START=465 /DNA_END=2780 /DNA_ORIENTATION=-
MCFKPQAVAAQGCSGSHRSPGCEVTGLGVALTHARRTLAAAPRTNITPTPAVVNNLGGRNMTRVLPNSDDSLRQPRYSDSGGIATAAAANLSRLANGQKRTLDADQGADQAAEKAYDAIVSGARAAAEADDWFANPPEITSDGRRTMLHGIERIYGPLTRTKFREVNLALIKAANQAVAALQIKITIVYVVNRWSEEPVRDFLQAEAFIGFDLYFSATIRRNVTLSAPLGPTVVKLATSVVAEQLQADGLAAGLLLLGVTIPVGMKSQFRPCSLVSSVIKITGPLQPFAIEKQTCLLATLSEQKVAQKLPFVTVNITEPDENRFSFAFPTRRRLRQLQEPVSYIGTDLVLPVGIDPVQLFEDLLGPDLSRDLAAVSLNVTLEWCNSTMATLEQKANGQSEFVIENFPPLGNAPSVEAGADSLTTGSSRGLGLGGAAGICVGTVVFLAMCAGVVFLTRRRVKHGLRQGQLPPLPSKSNAAENAPADASTGYDSPAFRPSAPPTILPSEIVICKRDDGSDYLLGKGSFGHVFRGLRRGVQDVAVKKLRPSVTDPTWVSCLDREIAILSSVSFDRNVVQYYGSWAGDEAAQPFIVMEYLAGGDLRAAILRDPVGLTWHRRGCSVALDIAKGLHFLHSCGVIHRDLKASNVLLSAEGVAKISDVGLATVATAVDPGCWDQLTGAFCYAAPELILGVRCTDKVDIFSFGVLLWELSTQEMPIRGQLRDVQVPEECPQAVADLIDACLQANPLHRPSAADLCDALKRALEASHPAPA